MTREKSIPEDKIRSRLIEEGPEKLIMKSDETVQAISQKIAGIRRGRQSGALSR